jgi:hypothetical protein
MCFAILVYKDGEWAFQMDHEVGKAYGDNKERMIYNLLEVFPVLLIIMGAALEPLKRSSTREYHYTRSSCY